MNSNLILELSFELIDPFFKEIVMDVIVSRDLLWILDCIDCGFESICKGKIKILKWLLIDLSQGEGLIFLHDKS